MSVIKDQAENLRKTFSKNKTKIVLVTGGKGGVGKSIVAVNTAVNLAKLNKKVLIFDTDAGFANASILLGVTPAVSIKDYFDKKLTLEECIIKTPYGIKLLSTGMDIKDWLSFQKNFTRKAIEEFFQIAKEHDYVIIDVSAGYNENLKPFYIAADNILLVTTPEPTAIVNAYTVIKALSLLEVDGIIDVVINMIRKKSEANTAEQVLRKTIKEYLYTDIRNVFYINFDHVVHDSVKSQVPISSFKPSSNVANDLFSIAEKLENMSDTEPSKSNDNLLKKLLLLFGFYNR
ncbi:ATPase involved in chromosome partitioning [Marinitoga piezophila KA3]|uniref:ATPase involved in chromosome partitioning n=1 Tax=Marinitoga piezophila (strain DSM 14283 / JCM 11233 / KA3) TaxID=443254 RepID=H2J6H4_MARPK|nr:MULTISPECIES: P-loop NTPase [Marinitoga]AEX85159.1 ATPase involved in chromosome partitioning [Marinitoga piezophila KA3]